MTLTNKIIRTIELGNFKGYKRDQDHNSKIFDFDNADLILVTGKNGVGKTSLLEALNWTLNQEGIPKKYLTSDKTEGLVIINDTEFNIGGNGSDKEDLLKTASTFFFQENIKKLACNEVIQLLEPDNKPAQVMKASLKSLQLQLETWQQQLQQTKYRKNYEAERKNCATTITELTELLDNSSEVKALLKSSTLTLKNGNLQSRWDSQIRNLSTGLSQFNGQVQVIGESIPEHLEHVAKCLNEVQSSIKSDTSVQAKKQEFDRVFFERLMQLPSYLEIKWIAEAKENNVLPLSLEGLVVEFGKNKYLSVIHQLSSEQEALRNRYRSVSEAISRLSDVDGLDKWVKSFHNNVDQWLSAFDDDTESVNLHKIVASLTTNLAQLETLSLKKLQELHQQRKEIEDQGKQISSQIERLNLYNSSAELLNSHELELKTQFSEKTFKISDVLDYAKRKLNEQLEFQPEKEEINSLKSLIDVFQRWSHLEHEKKNDEENISQPESIESAETLLSSAIKICKQEAGTNSQLLNLMSEIPAVELENLTENMNSLLNKFHFPKGFLPIQLRNIGTERNPEWTFTTKNNVKFDDLSTGQKTQLAICWTINLNLSLSDALSHRVIGFDDFTTSLDMNQMIPAAVLLRKLAYANDEDKWKRQVIVTSHHEDLTNRLLDFLLPPHGKTMRVIQFEDWSPEAGPSFNCYKVDMGNQVQSNERVESAITRLLTN